MAKYKKFLYIKNEKDEGEIQQIYPKPPNHVDSGKPHETTKIGPFMAAPILNIGSYQLEKGDFKDLKAFIDRLNDETNLLSKFIKNKLSPEILGSLNAYEDIIGNDQLVDRFIDELNNLLGNEFFYSKELFRDISLSREIEDLLLNVPTQKEDILYINRLLLEDVYRDELTKCYVLGVIRLPHVADGGTEFTEYEKRIFNYFAIRLSQSIENANIVKKYNNLVSIYRRIGHCCEYDTTDNILDKLFEVVRFMPEIVGGGYCTIFTIESEMVIPQATTSTSKPFLEIVKRSRSGTYLYDIKGPGLTSWVARNKKPIRIDNISNEKEIRKIDPDLIALRPVVEIEYDDVGPFLAVPIIRDGNSVGVIRVLRRKGARPFKSMDETLLTGSAELLSLVLSNIIRNKEFSIRQSKATEQWLSIFSSELVNKGIIVKEISYAHEINDFFNTPVSGEISEKIKDSLDNLWKKDYGMSKSISLLSDFKNYEDMLLELPGYRDHFIHQFQVFILGAIIIDDIYKIGKEKNKKSFLDFYSSAIKEPGLTKQHADFAWLIASSFHDIAYPIEKSDKIFDKFFSNFMGIEESVIQGIRLEYIIYDSGYQRLIDNLADFYVSLQNTGKGWAFNGNDNRSINVDACFNEALWRNLLKKRDHGVLGALILLHQSLSDSGTRHFSTVIYPAALAIALHGKLLLELQEDIVFEQNPLAFLLRFCDLSQEWGRGNAIIGNPNLSKIDVNYNESDNMIHVRVEISLGNAHAALKKEIEARDVFGRLFSRDMVFELKINDTGKEYSSLRRLISL